jgi:sterol desaturase/sphingolipid hydroxylase (fatty acid hydroxylase superfamily)
VSDAFRFVVSRRDLVANAIVGALFWFAFGVTQVLLTPLLLTLSDERTLGRALSLASGGALLSGLCVTAWKGPRRPAVAMLSGALVGGGLLLSVGLARPSVRLVTAVAFGVTALVPVLATTSRTLWQTAVPQDLLGRALSLRQTLMRAALPIGALVAGPTIECIVAPLVRARATTSAWAAHTGRESAVLAAVLGVLLLSAATTALATCTKPAEPHGKRPLVGDALERVIQALPSDLDERRARLLRGVPEAFSTTRHLVILCAAAVLPTAGALAFVRSPTLTDAVVLVGTIVFANLVEYLAHRWLFHQDVWPHRAYSAHVSHHLYFPVGAVHVRSSREAAMVLMPLLALVGMAAIVTPATILVGTVFSANAAALFVAGSLTYYLAYEVLHLAFHAPERSWISRNLLVRRLARRHHGHHEERTLRAKNYNVFLPLWDLLLGTYA